MDGSPHCGPCAYELSTRRARRLSLAALTGALGAALLVWSWGVEGLWEDSPEIGVSVALALLALVIGIAWSGFRAPSRELSVRDPRDEEEPEAVLIAPPPGSSPYRAAARRVVLALSPRVSARLTAAVMGGAMLLCALLAPAALHRPVWVEVEAVLAAWWGVVAVSLTLLLYRGFELRDDYAHFAPWARRGGVGASTSATRETPRQSWWSGLGDVGSLDGEGCALLLFALVVGSLTVGVAWLVVELVLPLLLFAAYALFMAGIARVANDRHQCRGELGRSVLWGLFFASLYVGPLVLLVWQVHVIVS